MSGIVGWDVGAVNVKAAWRTTEGNVRVASQAIEIWHEKDRLRDVLHSVLHSISPGELPDAMAVTMTAELSDAFAAKREGVLFVLDTVRNCYPGIPVYVFSLSGKFVPLKEAQKTPLDFAASNWLASAAWIARQIPGCLILDVGSTTSDIVPVVDGQVRSSGRTDMDRLISGELVYTGALRTNLAAIVSSVPVRGAFCRVASEYFAISGDVHLILGHLTPDDYACTTPDGRPPSIDAAYQRIARLICADTEMLSKTEILEVAHFIYNQQVRQIRDGIEQVLSRFPRLRNGPVLLLGKGAFLGEAAVGPMGLEVGKMAGNFSQEQLAVAPCVAVASLLLDHLEALSQ